VLKEVEKKKGAWKQMAEQQQRINEAAQQFTDALVQSFRATADRTVGAQEQGAQLTQEFFNRVIENLRTQAEDTRQVGQQLADQQQRAAEAGQTLTQESVDAYMDFVNSMFSFWQGSTQAAQRGTERAGGGS
jgi:ABC-type transporter Mla subunit MlaD